MNMKNILTLLLTVLLTVSLLAQAPEKMSYQAVIRNNAGQLISNANIGMKVSILEGSATGNAVYVETHTPVTNVNGLVSVEVGNGTVLSGIFSSINWGNGVFFIKTETDPNGGADYTIIGTQQLLSVPYAFHAATADSIIGGLNNSIHIQAGNNVTITGSGTQVDPYIINSTTISTGSLALPTVTTNTVTGITSNSARFGGDVTNATNNQIIERGIIITESSNPSINNTKIRVNSGIGAFDTVPEILPAVNGYTFMPNTTYYIRAYVITENNIYVLGNVVSFTTLPVGQIGPGGGIVFFDKGNNDGGWQYLEVAPSDQSSGISWGCSGTTISGTQETLGSGEANTALILSGCNETSFAAKLCSDLTLGGQSDWFLPSSKELKVIAFNLKNGTDYFLFGSSYWTSLELSNSSAAIAYPYGGGGFASKSNSHYVRAIRAY